MSLEDLCDMIIEVPPYCHFTIMELHASDYEEWYECKHCGHVKPIQTSDYEH